MKLLLIDSRVSGAAELIAARQEGVDFHLYDWAESTLSGLAAAVAALGCTYTDIALVQHGSAETPELAIVGSEPAARFDEEAPYPSWDGVIALLRALGCARFDFLACALYKHRSAPALFAYVEAATGVDVAASTNLTGSAEEGGPDSDWTLESDNVDVRERYFTEALADFRGVLGASPSSHYGLNALERSTEGGRRVVATVSLYAAVDSSGAVVWWGAGQGLTPTKVTFTGARASSVAANTSSVMALCTDGKVRVVFDGSASLLAAGTVVTNTSGMTKVYCNEAAFAGVDGAGNVYVWGTSTAGGGSGGMGSASLLSNLTGVTRIWSTQQAFAALVGATGAVSVWGSAAYGGSGSSTPYTMVASGAIALAATLRAFAVVTASMLVVKGDQAYGGGASGTTAQGVGTLTGVPASGQGFITVAGTGYAFALILRESSTRTEVYAWGNLANGSASSTGTGAVAKLTNGTTSVGAATEADGYDEITSLFPSMGSFTAVSHFGKLYAWGQVGCGGGTVAYQYVLLTTASVPRRMLAATDNAFLAVSDTTNPWITTGGNLEEAIVWGKYNFGGVNTSGFTATETTPADIAGKAVRTGLATTNAFAVELKDGTVWAWGQGATGGLNSTSTNFSKAYQLSVGGVTSPLKLVAATTGAFLVQNTSTGALWVWGSSSSGSLNATATTRTQVTGSFYDFSQPAPVSPAPSAPTLTSTTVVEGASFTATLAATNIPIFTLSGTDEPSFEVVNGTTLQSKAGTTFNAEGGRAYSFTVTATNDGGSASTTFTISVTNTAPTAPTVTGPSFVVSGATSYSADLSATDAGDAVANTGLTFAITGSGQSLFAISGAKLVAAAGTTFSAPTTNVAYTLSVTAVDAFGATSPATAWTVTVLAPFSALQAATSGTRALSTSEVTLATEQYLSGAANRGSAYATLRTLLRSATVSSAATTSRLQARANVRAGAALSIPAAEVAAFLTSVLLSSDATATTTLSSSGKPLQVLAPDSGGGVDLPTDFSSAGGAYVDASSGSTTFRYAGAAAIVGSYSGGTTWTSTAGGTVGSTWSFTAGSFKRRFRLAGVGSALLTPLPPDPPVLLDAATVTEGGMFSARVDASGTATSFAIVAGVGNGSLFDLSGSGVTVSLISRPGTTFDIDGQRTYSVTLTASNDAGTSANSVVTITVLNAPPSVPSLTPQDVVEGNTYTGTLSASDPGGAGAALHYEVSGTDAGAFTLSGSTLTSKSTTSKHGQGSYSILVRTLDASGAASAYTPFTITVTNAAPSVPTLSPSSIAEGASYVGTLTAVDPGGDTALTYELQAGVGDASSFTLSGATLTLKAPPSFYSKPSYSVSVRALDRYGAASAYTTLALAVTNVAPSATTLSPNSVNEGGEGAYVGTLTASDVGGSPITFTLSGADASSFTVSGSTLLPKVTTKFNGSAKTTYTLIVTAQDAGGMATPTTLTLTVNNLAPVSLTALPATVLEGSKYVGTVSAADPGGAALTFDVSGAMFDLSGSPVFDAATGRTSQAVVSKGAAVFSAHVAASHSFVLTARDPGGLTAAATYSVTVTNVAPSPPTLSPATVLEGATAYVGTLSTVDPGGDTSLTYDLSGGDAALFDLSGATLRWRSGATFSAYSKGTYTLPVTAKDRYGAASSVATLTLTVTNVAPSATSLSPSTVDEGGEGTYVGTLSASDPGGSPLTFALSGADAASFDLSGARLVPRVTTHFKAQVKASYAVTVTATDVGGMSTVSAVTLTVRNLPPTALGLTPLTVAEGQAYAGTVTASDPGGATPVTFDLSGTDATLFDLSGTTLTSKTTTHFAAHVRASYTLWVRAVDPSGFASAFTPFSIAVQNVGPSPPTLSPATVLEGATAYVGTLSTVDPGGDTSLTYDLSGGDAALFDLSGATLRWRSGATFSAYSKGTYTLPVTAKDRFGAASAVATLTLAVTNVAPSATTLSPSTVDEGSEGTYVGTLSASDPGASPLTFTLSGADAAAFDVSGATLVPRAGTKFQAHVQASYEVTVTATDVGGMFTDSTLTLTVQNLPPTVLGLTPLTVTEGQAYAGTVTGSDPGGAPINFYVSGGGVSSSGARSVNGDTGVTSQAVSSQVRQSAYSAPSLLVKVQVWDSLGGTATQYFTVTVLNAPPAQPTLSSTTPLEGEPFEARVSASDPGGSPVTFDLSGADASLFVLSSEDGGVTVLRSLPSTLFSSYARPELALTVTARDFAGATSSTAFTLTVVNAPPSAPTVSNEEIAEGGAYEGTLSAVDLGGAPVTFTLAEGLDSALFDVSGASLRSRGDAPPFLRRDRDTFTVRVVASDGGVGGTTSSDLTLRVVNAPPPPPTLWPLTVTEGSAYLGTLHSMRADGSEVTSFQVLEEAGVASWFGLMDAVLYSTSEASFSAYAQATHTLRVVAVDADGAASAPATFTLTVENVAPGAPLLTPLTVDEGAAYVGELSAIDPGGPQPFTYTLSGPDADSFDVSGATLLSKPGTRFSASILASPVEYRVRVAATDSVGLAGEAADYTIRVNNLPPGPVTLEPLSAPADTPYRGLLSVMEPGGGATRLELGGEDAALFLVEGVGDGRQFTLSTVPSAPLLSAEEGGRTSYSLLVRALDLLSSASEWTPFTITLVDGVPMPPTLQPLFIMEGGAYAGVLATMDTSSPVTYTLRGPDASLFDVSGSALLSRPGAAFSLTQGTYEVEVVARDEAGTVSMPARILLTVVNAPPGAVTVTPAFYVLGVPYEGTLRATDPGGGAVTFALVGDAGRFDLSGSTLRTKARAHHLSVPEDTATLQVAVAATDELGEATTTLLSLTVVGAPRPTLLLTDVTSGPAPPGAPMFVAWQLEAFSGWDDPSGFEVSLQRLEGGGGGAAPLTRQVDASGRYTGFAPPPGGWPEGLYELRVAGGVAEPATALVLVQASVVSASGSRPFVQVQESSLRAVGGRGSASALVGAPHLQFDAGAMTVRFGRADRRDGFGVDVARHALTFTRPGPSPVVEDLVRWDAEGNGVTVTAQGGAALDELVTKAGGVSGFSDARLKKDVAPLDPEACLEAVLALRPVSFQWKRQEEGNRDVGFIAQEVAKVEARLVTPTHLLPSCDWPALPPSAPPYATVAYEKVTALLIGAVQAQEARLVALRAEVAALREAFGAR